MADMTSKVMAKPRRAIIIGADADVRRTIHMCCSAGIVPIGIFLMPWDPPDRAEQTLSRTELVGPVCDDEAFLRALPERLQVVDEEELRNLLDDAEVTMICGSYGVRERDYFIQTLVHIKNKLGIPGVLRHPAYLIKDLLPDFGNLICGGYAGSGNMTVQKVLEGILRLRASNAAGPIVDAARAYAVSYWSSLSAFIEGKFLDAGLSGAGASQTHQGWGVFYVHLGGVERPLIIAGLPMGMYVWHDPWIGSHEPPTRNAIDFFSAQGGRFVYVVRNPLDVVVSLAGKASADSQGRYVEFLLDNDEWLRTAVQSVAQYTRHILENRHDLILVRYEDLLVEPQVAIRSLAKDLGTEITDDDVNEIWSAVSGKTLSSDHGHYWRPGEGKWAEYIPVESRKLVEDTGVISLSESLGYEVNLDRLTRRRGTGGDGSSPDPYALAIEDVRFAVSMGKERVLFDSDLSVVEGGGLVLAGPADTKPILEDLVGSSFLRSLLDAVDRPDTGPSIINKEYLNV